MRICLVYDCLFPYTVGGAERWYRNLAERLAADGHEVTYLTLRQWERGERRRDPGRARRRRRARGWRSTREAGRRRILPPLVFGAGVLWHLLRHGGRYDVVHTASFPYFSLLAAGARCGALRGFRLVVDWHEVWSRDVLARVPRPRRRADRLRGAGALRAGAAARVLLLAPARRAAARARACAASVTVLEGEYAGPLEPADAAAGGAAWSCSPAATSRRSARRRSCRRSPLARERIPELRGEILGDGPERGRGAAAAIARARARRRRRGARASSTPSVVERALRRALCMVLPSRARGLRAGRRRGVGARHAERRRAPATDNAATELVEEGVNGFVAPSASPEDLAAAIVRVHEGGDALRERPRRGSRATRSGSRSTARSTTVARELPRASARS